MKKRNHTLEYYHKIRGIDKMMEHLPQSDTEKMDEHDTSNEIRQDPEKKYPALRFVASFYTVLAVCLIVIAICGTVSSIYLIGEGDSSGWIVILVSALIGPLVIISLFALSESIMVFIDVAENLSKIKEDMGEDLSEIKRRLADKSD